MRRDAFQGGTSRGGRGGPHQEYGFDTAQRFIQRLWNGQISTQDFNLRRKPCRVRVADQDTNVSGGSGQLRNHGAADVTGAADDENSIHANPYFLRVSATFANDDSLPALSTLSIVHDQVSFVRS